MATGQFENSGEHDWFSIYLLASSTYEITETGLTDFAALAIGTATELTTDDATTSSTLFYPYASAQTDYLSLRPSPPASIISTFQTPGLKTPTHSLPQQ